MFQNDKTAIYEFILLTILFLYLWKEEVSYGRKKPKANGDAHRLTSLQSLESSLEHIGISWKLY